MPMFRKAFVSSGSSDQKTLHRMPFSWALSIPAYNHFTNYAASHIFYTHGQRNSCRFVPCYCGRIANRAAMGKIFTGVFTFRFCRVMINKKAVGL